MFLGRNDTGKIEAGNVADLVLLTADPVQNIRNAEKIAAVIANGQYLDRAALDQLLTKIANAVREQK
jgi:imidazolonepropionase-like amidohydrolase